MSLGYHIIRNLITSGAGGGRVGESWWLPIEVEGEEEFAGCILHIHLDHKEDWIDVLNDIQKWVGVVDNALDVFNRVLGSFSEGDDIDGEVWSSAANEDGSYDFYIMKEPERSEWWRKVVPDLSLNFTGFVSDQENSQPVTLGSVEEYVGKLQLLSLLVPNLYHDKVIKLSEKFREHPHP